ncbi:MAG TPA: GntR family transcriptional regulator [Ktedonobacteraceae bacterium]|jgi:DNA-binding GntR family transcriptional regulator
MDLQQEKDSRPRTKQLFVYQTLRDAIMHCTLQPGERLVTETIAHQLNVSLIPVREALQLLRAEGLVESSAHVGARVAAITRESVVETFTLMEGLELVATRTVAERLSHADDLSLQQIVQQMDDCERDAQFEQWGNLNSEFHLKIAQITAMPLLYDMTTRVFGQWDRIRRYFFKDVLALRIHTSQEEHHALLAALQQGDTVQLARLVQTHNQAALAAYLAYLSSSNTTEPIL